MSVKSIGRLPLALAVPGVASAAAQLGAVLVAQQLARDALAARFAAPVPVVPDPGTLKSAVLASLPLYNPAAALAAIASARATLVSDLASANALVDAALPVLAMLNGALAAPDVAPIAFDGDASSLAELAPAAASLLGAAPFQAIVLLAPSPAAWAALSALFRTS
jgi:hypothetical protein